jgi:hypothetical protein
MEAKVWRNKSLQSKLGAAPMARHTAMMNFAIWFEVVAGLVLFAVAVGALASEVRTPSGCSAVPE